MSTANRGYNYLTIFEGIVLYVSEAPTYHIVLEVLLVLWIIKLLFFSERYHPDKDKDKPTKQEEEELIEEWNPEPLVPAGVYPSDRSTEDDPIVEGIAGPHVVVNGKNCLNLATFNFLGLLGDKSIQEDAANTVTKYGVGSCGPRGFYGTMDVHLELEDQIAKFTEREESIVYSYGFATIASVIPAYSKKKDIIFCDEHASFPILKGLVASRSKIKFFRHNDMEHLESLLQEQIKIDKKNPSNAKRIRKFIVAEGLYIKNGDIPPLPKLVEFRNRYRAPIILEESFSFGVLGKTGRGIVEHYGLSPDDVDLICVSMNNSLGSMGGFCAGKAMIVDHQRLSGVGYCFSASLPPLLVKAASRALRIMEEHPDRLERLRSNSKFIRSLLNNIPGIVVCGIDVSPIIHLRLKNSIGSRAKKQQFFNTVATKCHSQGLAVVTGKYIENEEQYLPPPSIRLAICSEHTEDELTEAASIIRDIVSDNFPILS